MSLGIDPMKVLRWPVLLERAVIEVASGRDPMVLDAEFSKMQSWLDESRNG